MGWVLQELIPDLQCIERWHNGLRRLIVRQLTWYSWSPLLLQYETTLDQQPRQQHCSSDTQYKVWDEITYPLSNFTAQPLKFGNG